MSITESEMALDTIVQQTWKRVRATHEIKDFLTRREQTLAELDSDELDFAVQINQRIFATINPAKLNFVNSFVDDGIEARSWTALNAIKA